MKINIFLLVLTLIDFNLKMKKNKIIQLLILLVITIILCIHNLYNYLCLVLLILIIILKKQLKYFIFKLYYNIYFYTKYLFSLNINRLYQQNDRKEKIIISLTTYNKRTKTVYKTIESIFNQTIKPDKIVLWLDKNEFNINNIPKTLKKQIKQGLEIDFYHNIKSYKKIVPSLKKYPNDIIITADDDVLYPKDFIEKLYNAYLLDNSKIYCNYSFKFLNKYYRPTTNIKELQYLFTYIGTGAGALFPPKILPNEILDEELFTKIAPIHDDIFISTLCMKYNIKIQNVNNDYMKYIKLLQKRTVFNTQSIGLVKQNYEQHKTEIQLQQCLEYFNITLQEL